MLAYFIVELALFYRNCGLILSYPWSYPTVIHIPERAGTQGIAFDTNVIEKTMYSETEDRTDYRLLVPMDDYREGIDGTGEDVYIRAALGAGIELHVPTELLEEQPDLIAKVRKYTMKLIKGK